MTTVGEFMTTRLVTMDGDDTLTAAAQEMRDSARGVVEKLDPNSTRLNQITSKDVVTVSGSVALIPRHGQRNRPWSALSRSWRLVTWYVKEVVGENDYEHCVEHLRHHHPHARPVQEGVRARQGAKARDRTEQSLSLEQ